MQMQPRKVLTAGRPVGIANPTPQERILRALPQIYESVRRKALAGDAEAARLCFEICTEPERYPVPTKKRNAIAGD